jgi:hypothetical protein
MGVERYRSVEEMHAAPLAPTAEEGFDRFIRHCARFLRMAPRVYPRGVFKFRSVEEAQEARDRITGENVRRFRPKPQS